jgi:uncharacterized protein YyaL (SSP411 family)
VSEKNQKPNRLIKEKSPYLLQHAFNPVNWYPWGLEAFEAARVNDKPIFLSIGYATCHWCHVMEKESFASEEIAKMMNDTFINIKVDREELPEVDNIYMEFAQGMMSGAAGWPLNIILTPDLQPFFAATYLPINATHGVMGIKELVQKIKGTWESDEREDVIEQSKNIFEMFEKNIHVKGNDEFPDKEHVDDAADLIFKMADPIYGGLKGSPKFPIGYQLNFMLRYYATSEEVRACFLAKRTLDMMQRGGIYDHLGGGFSRYSTDSKWQIPHFEKMLYDNALIAFAYLECWLVTKDDLFLKTCKETLHYVLREMTDVKGGFFSAEDADSEGHEGMFYTWTYDELINILGFESSNLIREYYGVTEKGNFLTRNVLHTPMNLDEFIEKKHLHGESFKKLIKEQNHLLWKVRENREHPLKDDKILTSWNGLMIFTFIEAGVALKIQEYVDAALKAATFIKNTMWIDGRLFRRFRENEVRFNAGLDEYAAMIRASISLFEADLGVSWLLFAIEMTNILDEEFKEPEGAFYQTEANLPHIVLRKCQFADGAEPSGNALHAENLMRLYQITGDDFYLDQAEDIFSAVKKFLDSYPPGYSYHVMNLNRYFDKHAPTIVIALNEFNTFEAELKRSIYSNYIPHKALIWRRKNERDLFRVIPFVKDMEPLDDKTTLYICYEGVCTKPLNELPEMVEAISKL